MHTLKATLVVTALLATGMLMAQEPATPSSPDTHLSTQSAPAPEGHGRHAMNPDKQAKHLARELNLTKDQVAQIRPILADRKQRIESLRADTSLAPQDRRAKMQAIQQDSKSKIDAVLNDTQKQQFEHMLANRRAHHKGAPAQPEPVGQPS